ncbi:hypothetical protein [Desulfosporosinus sp. OT]|uniref:hypothetical protein n=1 Tax=Desulfosporosinus sp. OT TaxID=913865 RepID=UPI0002239C39|nr:hypothetical protein [Desulfosporosinus sp. OT]EGW41584.1 hypothetical protein DOT_0475 [Desulfosporosinus sp. OT]
MIKKNILVFTLTLSIIGGATAIAYASQSTVDSTKNKVVTLASKSEVNGINQSIEGKTGDEINITKGKISDEEAVNIAAKAMKDYMGLDANSFGEAHITRTNAQDDFKFFMDLYPKEDAAVLKENAQKHTANVINVQFIPAANLKEPMPASNSIVINEETGEIVTLMASKNIDGSFKAVIDDAKVQTAVINFFGKLGKNVQCNTIKVTKTANFGTIRAFCDLEDGRDVWMTLNLKDYSVLGYEINYDRLITLPSVQKDYDENFRELQVK